MLTEFEQTIFRKERAYIKNGIMVKCHAAKMLEILSERPNQIVTNTEIVNKILGDNYSVDRHTLGMIRVHLVTLRDFLHEAETGFEIMTLKDRKNFTRGLMLIKN